MMARADTRAARPPRRRARRARGPETPGDHRRDRRAAPTATCPRTRVPAKNEQGLLERRIAILRDRFDHAIVVDGGGSATVATGSHVVIEDESGARIGVELSALGGPGTVSPSSPLGSAILGKKVGDAVRVKAPSGSWRATIVELRPAAAGA
jgi:hypothetical protein